MDRSQPGSGEAERGGPHTSFRRARSRRRNRRPGCAHTTDSTAGTPATWITDGELARTIGAGQAGDPVVVAGDLNLPPHKASIRCLRASGLVDAYAAVRHRPGPTWNPISWLPSPIRIDYIRVPASISVINAWTLELPGSDHRVVMTEIDVEGWS